MGQWFGVHAVAWGIGRLEGRGGDRVKVIEDVILWYLLVRRYKVGGSTCLDLCLWGGELTRLALFRKGGRVEGGNLTSSTRVCLHLQVGDTHTYLANITPLNKALH